MQPTRIHRAFVALGSNMAEPEIQMQQAFAALARLAHTQVLRTSSLYRSAPIACDDGADFVNAVVELETQLSAHDLLQSLLTIERQQGRVRSIRNAPRTLDLDLLLYDQFTLDEPGLTLPHPRMHQRAFVLLPLLEIAPDCTIPGKGRAADNLRGVQDQAIMRLA